MKRFNWDNDKNRKLIQERGISFEEIIFCIEKGYMLDKIEHPNQEKYRGQKIFVVQVDDYVYLVPFIENDREVFLKTIIPSRKATKLYLKGDK
ncbi:MAG: toxin [Elusimicrobia bacterium RIFOXYB2_FULL_48_7]|nr:MAG: toxin [Elusimicrobia bacterium RIFOXYB2_FULL_48_7]